MDRLSAEEFFHVFEQVAAIHLTPDVVREKYNNPREWTLIMQGKDDNGVLPSIARQLVDPARWNELKGWPEFYKIDYVIGVGGLCLDFTDPDGYWPMNLLAIIEHENTGDIRSEMYKLAIFRSPLKVLISYDYDLDGNRRLPDGEDGYAEKKLKTFEQFLTKTTKFCKEDPDTQYLFIFGNREPIEKQKVIWRAWKITQGECSCKPIK